MSHSGLRVPEPTTETTTKPSGTGPPGSWRRARSLVRRAFAPVERFLAVEAASGIVLLVAAGIALLWANSPSRESYGALWHTQVGMTFGAFSFERDLRFWINEGLMTIFFFVVGLEIRRELHGGELSSLKRAALPLAAAVGGMVVPASIFLLLNRGRASGDAWGIPMATDIAFAIGVLALFGKRVPPALRILLLALAVIDDVGAILVIAVFYSSGVAPRGFVIVGAGLAVILGMRAVGVRNPWVYVIPGVVVWAGTYAAGIHPTIAGVALGLLTPAQAWYGPQGFADRAEASVSAVRDHDGKDERVLLSHLDHLNQARREAISPVESVEHGLHGWVAYAIMPLFAFANAGVSLGAPAVGGDSLGVLLGVCLGLVVGKPIGILALSLLAARAGLAALPRGVTWSQVGLVGVVGGIGFTMSLFIAQLAFPGGDHLETAKVGILLGSGVSAVAAYLLGRFVLPSAPPTATAPPPSAAGSSTLSGRPRAPRADE